MRSAQVGARRGRGCVEQPREVSASTRFPRRHRQLRGQPPGCACAQRGGWALGRPAQAPPKPRWAVRTGDLPSLPPRVELNPRGHPSRPREPRLPPQHLCLISGPPRLPGHGVCLPSSAMELAELRLLDALAYLLGVLAIPCFLLPKLVGLSYGRYVSPSTSMCQVPARVAWSLQELPSLIVPLYLCAGTEAERLHCWPNRLLLAMFLIHYVQRCLVYPFLIRGGKPTPLYIFLLATLFCTYNGYMQSQYLSQYAVYADDWVTDPRFLIGSVLWLVGMLINLHSDHILRCLRKPGETSYKIPQGGLFELVTAANYFGEVVEWGGFALASWSVQSGTFALFTFCFLFSRAQVHHQ
ncbi:3-oxo-5-alpha-steroid 4-dehydrogenase 1 [Galemys pyrenaicus]|uniref:3-oxo-5alpha-steroid 4-dehydrogenase (NADP(+)) n=1 Tax=Galemys pyrenaicus TaxID=202257 RepID=A0A8J6A0W5_GALPY|nr:3-oxo-5-alpha-steroid 4-dehydrogenase 1 [Galemys pyrenaicus]